MSPCKNGGEHKWFGRVRISRSTCDTSRITYVKRGEKDGIDTTNVPQRFTKS